ncbi:MAG TPA: hypothetical protein VFX59_10180 [Polyangiales bacterium]|nr:hypothetical protein [Polyangiales bacterium]
MDSRREGITSRGEAEELCLDSWPHPGIVSVSEHSGHRQRDMRDLLLFFLALVAAITGLASAHRMLKGRWHWRTLLTLGWPLVVLVIWPPENPWPDVDPDATLEPRELVFLYFLLLVLSLEQSAIAQAVIRLRWPLYLTVCSIITLIAWLSSAAAVIEIMDP